MVAAAEGMEAAGKALDAGLQTMKNNIAAVLRELVKAADASS